MSICLYLNVQHPIEELILRQPPSTQELIHYLRAFLKSSHAGMEELYKYKTLFFHYKGKAICYIHSHKGLTHIGFVDGSLMKEHKGLVSEGRSQVRVYKVFPEKDIDVKQLETILKEGREIIDSRLKK